MRTPPLHLQILVALFLTMSAFSAPARAGSKSSGQVYINSTSRYAYGSTGGARNSLDANQNIGCTVFGRKNTDGTTTLSALCWATNSVGVYRTCSTSDSKLITAASSVGTDSTIQFNWDTSSYCTYIEAHHGSDNPPKAP
jgi:hypothetical protein